MSNCSSHGHACQIDCAIDCERPIWVVVGYDDASRAELV